ncbi:PAS domain S-box protein [Mucilaginibacter pallidiroseus]|nr:PAS domain S-box protein [Mucilaginibacter pallidiroseus]
MENAMQASTKLPVQNIEYWQNRLFTNAIIYALPGSLLALIPSVYLECRSGNVFLAGFNVFALVTVAAIALARGISLHTRRIWLSAIIAVFAIVLTALLGTFSMACIYLFSLSVFVALQFSDRIAYGTVIFNFLVCAGFALVIHYKLFPIPLLEQITLDRWIIYSANFVFMDIVVVVLIRQTLNGLSNTMHKELSLYNELQQEAVIKADLNAGLKNSEAQYRTLFYQSPSPKLIFDAQSLRILQVNDAAVRNYGYSLQEFLQMKITDIYPDRYDADEIVNAQTNLHVGAPLSQTTQHLGKNGDYIHVEVNRADISYQGKPACMIVATDITQRVNHIDAIQKQNDRLLEIAHMQSHILRLPLARIMALSDLIEQEYKHTVDPKLLGYLNTSANELDNAIKAVVNKSADILTEQQSKNN